MIVIRVSSFELSNEQLIDICKLIAIQYDLRGYPLPLAADDLRGRQVELILTPKKIPLSP